MARHFIARNKEGEFFFGFVNKSTPPNFIFVPKFMPDVQDGYSLAVVFEWDKLEEVRERLTAAGIEFTITEF